MAANPVNNEKIDMSAFVSGLMAEGLVSLGVINNPATGKASKDMGHARMVIDTLEMLLAKTKGNLTPDEDDDMHKVLHHLRMLYVSEMERPNTPAGDVPGEVK